MIDDEQQDLDEAYDTLDEIGNSLRSTGGAQQVPPEPPEPPPLDELPGLTWQELLRRFESSSPEEDAPTPDDPPNDAPAAAQQRKGGSLPDWLPWVIAAGAGLFAARRKS